MFSTLVMASDTNSVIEDISIAKKNGWYIGSNIRVINFGGSGETIVTNNNRDKSTDYIGNIQDMPINIKLGYITTGENRLEIYYQNDKIKDEIQNILTSSILGFNYQFGLSSLSSTVILPFLRIGIGFGSTTLEKRGRRNEEKSDIAAEFNTALGIYFKVFNNFDISTAIYRKSLSGITLDENDDDDKSTTTVIVTNGVEIGFSYHF